MYVTHYVSVFTGGRFPKVSNNGTTKDFSSLNFFLQIYLCEERNETIIIMFVEK